MGQKSLPQLHKINTSMLWECSLYNSNYKWLSYNLWFIFTYYYKFNLYSLYQTDLDLKNYFFENTLIIKKNYKNYKLKKKNIRFSYFIELYCLEYYSFLILINVFFLTDLNFFKKQINHTVNSEKILLNFFL